MISLGMFKVYTSLTASLTNELQINTFNIAKLIT